MIFASVRLTCSRTSEASDISSLPLTDFLPAERQAREAPGTLRPVELPASFLAAQSSRDHVLQDASRGASQTDPIVGLLSHASPLQRSEESTGVASWASNGLHNQSIKGAFG